MIVLPFLMTQSQAASPAVAPPAKAIISVDQARVAAARQLIATLRIDRTLDLMFTQLAPGFASSVIGVVATDVTTKAEIDNLIAAAPTNRDRMLVILSEEFLRAVRRQYPAFQEKMAQEYASAFTLEELKAINNFYLSGPGAKALSIMSELQTRMSIAGRELGRSAGEEAGRRGFERIESEMAPDSKPPAA